ncbi:MAG: MBL fold metallo-hydrolase [Haloarculaceae archaeon]
MTVRHDGLRVEWLGYATARIEGDDAVVYLDPGRYGVLDGYDAHDGAAGTRGNSSPVGDGDLVCITHPHHYDPDGVRTVAASNATVVVYDGIDVEEMDRDVEAPEDLPYRVLRVDEEDHFAAHGVDGWTLPAYNEPDGPHTRADGTPYHPRGFGVGYLLSVDGVKCFWPGDSDVLAGHREVDASLFLANIGGTYAMDRHEAAALAEAMDPELVLPIHYGTFEALAADSGEFAKDVAKRGVPVVLDEESVELWSDGTSG